MKPKKPSFASRVLFEAYFGIPAFYWMTLGLVMTAALLALWFVVDPAPPTTVTIATGAKGGFYDRLGRRFKSELERHGLKVKLLASRGSVDNLRLLRDGKSADVGFVQGGVAGDKSEDQESPLRSLATLALEPVWVFAKQASVLTDFEGRQGLRIAAGAIGSGTRDLSRRLLDMVDVLDTNQLVGASGNDAADKLVNDEVDVVIYVSSPSTPWVQRLLNEPSVTFVSAQHAPSLVRIFPFLSELKIPARTLNFPGNIPKADMTLIGASTNLVVRLDLHSAVKDLLLQTSGRLQLGNRLLGTFGKFPSADFIEYPLDPEAQRFFEYGPTLVRRYLPYWLGNLIERFWILVFPMLTVLIPLIGFGPPLFQWHMRRRIYVWYRDLNRLVSEAVSADTPEQRRKVVSGLEELQDRVSAVDVPLPYVSDLYRLRAHIDFVRKQFD
ncbi:MAG: TAXI family TRAP transporter solute-binding subunit [Hyphomicrobiaceae bacterium]